ncbi:MAG TPA: transporter substrate-binding domain-containing protein, partial [Chthoniobacterales bacterium]|nr:transporter substrate-binding domain-containing protein [Chthoniobacterales bacterium]
MIIYFAPGALRSAAALVFSAVALLTFGVSARAQEPATTAPSGKSLTVVTRKITPFVMERNGRLTGYSIELWERVVREARLPFDPDKGYQIVDNVTQMLDELRSGRADAAVAAVSITSEREKTIDFTYPFKESGLQILTKDEPGGSFRKTVAKVFKGDIL